MQQNPSTGSNANGTEITLAQINEMLNAAGFPIIGPARVQSLQQIAPRERIIRAIRIAKTDSGARAFLTNLFEQAGIALNNQPEQPQTGINNQGGEQQDPSASNANGMPGDTSGYQPQGQYEQQPQARNQSNQQRGQGNGHQNQNQRHQNQRSQSNSREPQQGAGNEEGRMNPEDRASVHVYGGKAALCFEADITKGQVPTIALDAAMTTGPRQYDWAGKVRLQLTRAELPVVTAVLIGALQRCEFKNHGQDNSKGFSMERQEGGKVFIKVFAKDQGVRGVPVMAPDVFYVASLMMRQLRKANPWLDGTALMSLIRATQSGQ